MTGVAVVAGGSEHTGLAVALRLAAGGFDVALLDTEFTAADKTVRRIEESGRRCITVEAELTDARSVGVAFGQVRTELSSPAVLVTCVGPEPVPDGLPEDEFADEQRYTLVRRSLRPAFVCCQAGAGQLLHHRCGRIIIVTEPVDVSENAWRTSQPVLAGLIGFTRSAALELARSGITVNLIAPADCAVDSRAPAHQPAVNDSAGSYADGVAHVTEFLVDEQAAGITGQAIYVAASPAEVPLLRER
ncbi:SDR family NAD(P)-dependent oxidoreductase [Streptomyces roseochromogenus]|uniref:CloK n=1 Tax=Streptomyces roseochromogenus subsp. oscitans TaxID=149682 RepID=Q8GHC4_STRRC|nr:SDR family NAD(P)-dependent oxidoreductase [Streptomyces roseochromogenus]AAN65227.1 cloK [Streptomyces roseochromogenus subsp. oscitans DS 12.976]